MTNDTDGVAESALITTGDFPGSAVQLQFHSSSTAAPVCDPRNAGLAESAASHAQHCRQALKQFQTTLSTRKVSPRELRLFSVSLDRHIQIVEADLSLFCRKSGDAREVLLRAEQEHELSVRLATERGLRELEVACNHAQANIDALSRSRRTWIAVAAVSASLAAVATFCAIVSYVQLSGMPTNEARRTIPTQATGIAGPLPGSGSVRGKASPLSLEENDFTKGADRLDAALGMFGGRNPEEVLRKVREDNAARGIDVCPFEWDRGKPSLLFGGKRDQVELDQVMTTCADAVAQAGLARMTAARPPPQ